MNVVATLKKLLTSAIARELIAALVRELAKLLADHVKRRR